ncbi:MAG: hypothetical protein ABEI06_09230 [Halobacteriaceae archaeon]
MIEILYNYVVSIGNKEYTNRYLHITLFSSVFLAVIAVDPVAAESTATAFCQTKLAATIRNIFTMIQFGGPILGGTTALGASVLLPYMRRADRIREIKQIRNQALVWGVIMAPLSSSFLQFILNNIVVTSGSCGF